jgi:hypothetical protein
MSKRKHKRRKQRAQERAQQQAEKTGLLEQVKVSKKRETEAGADRTNEGTHDKNPPWEAFMGWIKEKSSFTDWCLVFFTGVLAAAAIYQFIILGGQLNQMRKEQRPWINISFNMGAIQTNGPISATISLVNKGKTPARAITGQMAIDAVKNGEEPQLNYPVPHPRFTTGLIFPDEPDNVPFNKLRYSNSGGSTEPDLLTQSEFDDFQNGRVFFVFYADVSYKDFFGVEHWTRTCKVLVQSNVPGTFSGRKCTNYGDVDSN